MKKCENNNIINNIIKGVSISFLLTLVLIFIYSILLTYTNINENTMNPVLIIIIAISILVGSSISNMKIQHNGILNGGIIAIIYLGLLYLLSSIITSNFQINISTIIIISIGFIFGIIGGIIGVNKN